MEEFIASNIMAFREIKLNIDIISSNKIKNQVPINESRFYLVTSLLENFMRETITFSQESMADVSATFNQTLRTRTRDPVDKNPVIWNSALISEHLRWHHFKKMQWI